MAKIMKAATDLGPFHRRFPRFFPVAGRRCGVGSVNKRLKGTTRGPTLLGREDVVHRLAVGEMACPHTEHLKGPIIKGDRSAGARFSLRVAYYEAVLFEINLSPAQE